MRLKTPEQRERFRDFILPMPVPDEMRERIRQEAQKARALYQLAQIEPKQLTAHGAVFYAN